MKIPDVEQAGTVFVPPDAGGAVRAPSLQTCFMEMLLLLINVGRKAGVSEVMALIGDVDKKHAIPVDDMVDSGGTLCKA